MKTRLQNKEAVILSINWDKNQLLLSIATGNIILSNGIHNKTDFEGTIIINHVPESQIGEFSKKWKKSKFQVLDPNKEINISNSYL